ncbi:MAG TPA: alpha-amylase family glycosyl hydrolase [Rubrobacteraceae bacterium]|nr:alpha-amylase family glycosyl hydrolase [Rubrobacteraceae bacterium]
MGDLRGITSRLGYLAGLGIDGVWISPFFPSPMADFGYDISDYTGVHPMFGTLEDFDALVAEAHRLNLKVILDYVPNHTSDQHPWFVESRSSRDDPKRDWYIWRDPAPDGGPPNDWVASFGGGAWEWNEPSGQFYYHAYLKEQPDLNWRNPEVREAMMDVLRFWLERGVDGFRVDALRQLIKDDRFRDNPPNPDWRTGMSPYDALLPLYSTDRPEVHGAIREMRETLAEYGEDRLLIGELYLSVDRLVAYYGEDNTGVHLPFNFHLISSPWNARAIAGLIDTYEAALPPSGWPTWVLGNHDRSRIASRVGAAQARVAAMLLLTLRGTPTIYYGDELGMSDVPIPPGLVQDPWEKNVPGIGLGRDPERTPMQWDASANAGFCPEDVTPWLPIADDHPEVNVAAERDDPASMHALYQRLLTLRRAEPALSIGSYEPAETSGDLLAYVREREGRRFFVVLNLCHESRVFEGPSARGRVVLTTHLDRTGDGVDGALELRADEGAIVEIW